jgi:hypothetical protein
MNSPTSAAAGWRRRHPHRRSGQPRPPGPRRLHHPRFGSFAPLLDPGYAGIIVVGGTRFVFPSIDNADRNAVDVVASASAANTLSVASSACLAAKPSPTRAYTTGPRMLWPLTADPVDGETGPILSQLEHQPFGTALADARHPGQCGDVAVGESWRSVIAS